MRTCVIETSHSIEGPADTEGVFNPAKNRIRLNARAGQAAREAAKSAPTHKILPGPFGPLVTGVFDTTLKEKNGRITRGRYIKVNGSGLKTVGPQAFIAFVSADGSTVVNADLNTLLDNEPSQLLFLVPDGIHLGPYRLTITTHYSPSGGRELKTPHTTTFETVLTVVAPAP